VLRIIEEKFYCGGMMLMGFDRPFDTWWLVNKFKLMHDENVGLREIAYAGWKAGKTDTAIQMIGDKVCKFK
jgi:hypothetical protein